MQGAQQHTFAAVSEGGKNKGVAFLSDFIDEDRTDWLDPVASTSIVRIACLPDVKEDTAESFDLSEPAVSANIFLHVGAIFFCVVIDSPIQLWPKQNAFYSPSTYLSMMGHFSACLHLRKC